jgi:hypothetical protein
VQLHRAMNPSKLSIAFIGAFTLVFVGEACRSAPRVESPVGPSHKATRTEEEMLVVADSELFAAVLQTQLAANGDQYPFRIEDPRYDVHPYGTVTGYPELSAGVQGAAPDLAFGRARQTVINHIVAVRRRILKANGIREGVAVAYAQCAGVRAPTPPPVRTTSRARPKPVDVHAGCPKKMESYITVGLPVRGQPQGLREVRDTRGDIVDLRGDVWMAQVDQRSIGPEGWRLTQHAWLFRRDDEDSPLQLASTIQIAVIE